LPGRRGAVLAAVGAQTLVCAQRHRRRGREWLRFRHFRSSVFKGGKAAFGHGTDKTGHPVDASPVGRPSTWSEPVGIIRVGMLPRGTWPRQPADSRRLHGEETGTGGVGGSRLRRPEEPPCSEWITVAALGRPCALGETRCATFCGARWPPTLAKTADLGGLDTFGRFCYSGRSF
jgi:hypothetical protein